MPAAGVVKGSVSLVSEPGRLAISDDGTELYVGFRAVGSIQRISLPSLTPDLNIPLGSIPVLGQLYAYDLAVAPGNPKTIAVSLANSGWPAVLTTSPAGLAVYDDATMRPQVADPFSAGGLAPGGIITPGISESLKYLSGMIYIENGQVVDASSGTIVGSLPSSIYRHRAVLDSAPKVPMYRPPVGEPRWLTRAEFARLERELPEHLKAAAKFAVLTGLRMRAMLS